jgi:protein-disulfide isomerase
MSKDNLDKQETPEVKPEENSEVKPEETSEETSETNTTETTKKTPEESIEQNTEEDPTQTSEENSEQNTAEENPTPGEENTEHTPGENYDDGNDSDGYKKINFGYVALAILVAVILFFGAKNKILEYFSGEHNTKAPVVSDSKKDSIFPSLHTKKLNESNVPESMHQSNAQQSDPVNQTSSMSEDDIKKTVKDFILNNPEIIMESLTKFERKTNEQKAQKTKEYLSKSSTTISKGRPFLGNKDGTLNIVEFFDYRCVHCNKVYPKLVKLMQAYPNLRITLVPLPFMGSDSSKAVKYSLAVSKLYPNKFAAFHSDLIMAQAINDQFISKLITKYGFDKNKLTETINSDAISNLIKEDVTLAQKSGVQGVPSFVINGEFIPGAASYEEFKNKIDAMIKSSK